MPVAGNHALGSVALVTTILCFGTLWTCAKLSLDYLPPLWFTAVRFGIGGLFIATVLWVQGRLAIPDRADIPIILSVGGIMFGVYSSIFQCALEFIHAGRATVLGYTTAIFVTPIAILFLGERLNRVTLLGLVSALVGFLLLFNPGELDWSNKKLVFGNAMLIACVILWSGVIIHLRVHRRVTDTLALVPWYLLVAFIVAATAAIIYEGSPVFEVGITGWAIFLYAGVVCSGIGNWGVTTAIMNLPATTSTIGLLGVPVLALVISVAFLGEILTWSLLFGLVLIIFGIVAVTFSQRPEKRKLERENAL
ncbi:MAG: DMT family transporter [Pseudomonadota bacterium]|nr:DMT family transporter [Pseudomonadota bacterium]